MTKYQQGSDLRYDRSLGEKWEGRFIAHAWAAGWKGTRIEQRRGAPDVFLERNGVRVAHEVKHKKPMWCEVGGTEGCWGLEDYRIELFQKWSEEYRCPVVYTIHDWSPYGSRTSEVDDLADWYSAPLTALAESPFQYRANWRSYHQSQFTEERIDATVWHRFAFWPLSEVLA